MRISTIIGIIAASVFPDPVGATNKIFFFFLIIEYDCFCIFVKLTNFYEESYTNKTGNIDVDELATAITARMLGGNVRIPKTKVIEVDIQREIAVGKIDIDAVKSEEIKGKVDNKLNKLRKLRQKNGS